jgi:hypothetical protein
MIYRTLVALGVATVLVAGCNSPTGPRYPDPGEDDQNPRNPDNPGMTAFEDANGVLWVHALA